MPTRRIVQSVRLKAIAAADGPRICLVLWARPIRAVVGLLVGLLSLQAVAVSAQGGSDYVVLQTGGGKPLVSQQEVLPANAISSAALTFDFGFSTDETPTPGLFLDSFTVSIEDPSSATAVLATIDASGTVWAPSSPGAIVLSESDIQRRAIVPPGMQPILDKGMAFAVEVPLPIQFSGATETVSFELFDNQNGTASLGWYSNPQIVSIPEPGPIWGLSLGLPLIGIWRKRSR